MRNFREYTDMEVSILVEEMKAGKVEYTLQDLKDCQAEVVNRRLNTRYASIVSELMNDKLLNKSESDITPDSIPLYAPDQSVFAPEPEPIPTPIAAPTPMIVPDPDPIPVPPVMPAFAFEQKAPQEQIKRDDLTNKMKDLYASTKPKKHREVREESDFPVFSLTSGILAILPWLCMFGIYGLYGYHALYGSLAGNFKAILYYGIASVLGSFAVLLVCLVCRENLVWKMKVAKKLDVE
jgi:hypothetical protein